VLELVFRIRTDAPAGRTIVNLRRGLDATLTQLNEGGLDLQPDPSNRAGDLLDGAIAIVHPARVRTAEVERPRQPPASLRADIGLAMAAPRPRRWTAGLDAFFVELGQEEHGRGFRCAPA
jgi:hypothetical protein